MKQLEFWVELKPEMAIDQLNRKGFESKVLTEPRAINDLFKHEREKTTTTNIMLKLYNYGKSPMVEESALRKAKYLYHNVPDGTVLTDQ